MENDDFAGIIGAIRKTAAKAVDDGGPVQALAGTVRSVEPLVVFLDQRVILPESLLILTRNVTNYTVEMEVSHVTEENSYIDTSHTHPLPGIGESGQSSFDPNHNHEYKGVKKFLVLNELKEGERVLLIRERGGQKYYIIDRL